MILTTARCSVLYSTKELPERDRARETEEGFQIDRGSLKEPYIHSSLQGSQADRSGTRAIQLAAELEHTLFLFSTLAKPADSTLITLAVLGPRSGWLIKYALFHPPPPPITSSGRNAPTHDGHGALSSRNRYL
ncbi:hypothetical protein S40285_09952 [Stachybotrys chlorohalonatus IBT 40285]|uniref:Uncharacterized protein n=1 Tax=Stachybotrys chlorohalonatus (strain IBT 40285) TaxID=1283841 RepID=A0A084QIM3_STAC4|nr:hypothetical protein S40285_09952 [Stachybotrys chlorohalonata IBT 40285]